MRERHETKDELQYKVKEIVQYWSVFSMCIRLHGRKRFNQVEIHFLSVYLSAVILQLLLSRSYHFPSFVISAEGCKEMMPVPFGYDVITTCRLELDVEDYEDCHSVR